MRQDLLHDSCLGVGVILNVGPFLRGEPALFCGVAFAVSGMAAQMVAEGQHALCFVAALTEHVEMTVGDWPLNMRCSYQSGSRTRSV